uniref:Uncharacterized protein n=1 Tax=viral metagenome TaxID=1070528 RepID=A0A6C0J4D0_9ZZZZ
MNDEKGVPKAFKIRMTGDAESLGSITRFQELDPKFNIYKANVGMWVPFKVTDINLINTIAKNAGCNKVKDSLQYTK